MTRRPLVLVSTWRALWLQRSAPASSSQPMSLRPLVRGLHVSSPLSSHAATSATATTQGTFFGAIPPRSHRIDELVHVASRAASNQSTPVTLRGWLLPCRRVSKKLLFAPLRDASGTVQLVVRESGSAATLEEGASTSQSAVGSQLSGKEAMDAIEREGPESVVVISGRLISRPDANKKEGSNTGSVEVEVDWVKFLNRTSELPFQPSDEQNMANEGLRAKYRYLDLRRPTLTRNLALRSRVAHAARCYLHDAGFLEIETPMLLRSTPEGAREFLVPTRTRSSDAPPTFYALPQSPQQPKQLLIASGVTERYFQLAKCFRDEDGRKDRQPEFTQIDLEMGFVSGAAPDAPAAAAATSRYCHGQWRMGGGEVRDVMEGLIKSMWKAAKPEVKLPERFDVMTYAEAMERFGSDKPDLRFGLEIRSISDALAADVDADVDMDAAKSGKAVEVLCYTPEDASSDLSRKAIESLIKTPDGSPKIEHFRVQPAGGVNAAAALLLRKSGHVRAALAEMEQEASETSVPSLVQRLEEAMSVGRISQQRDQTTTSDGSPHTHIFISTRSEPVAGGSTVLGDLRLRLSQTLQQKGALEMPSTPRFLWVTEFPLFTKDDGDKDHLALGRWSSTHHPFTAPFVEDVHHLEATLSSSSSLTSSDGSLPDERIAKIRGQHYDLVLNGSEIGGGSVRIHDASLQRIVLERVLQLRPGEVGRFEHLLRALSFGAPPHGGMALGFDRLMAILCGSETIRDVIAFPKAASGADPVFGSPALAEGPLAGEVEDASFTHRADKVLRQYGLRVASSSSSSKE